MNRRTFIGRFTTFIAGFGIGAIYPHLDRLIATKLDQNEEFYLDISFLDRLNIMLKSYIGVGVIEPLEVKKIIGIEDILKEDAIGNQRTGAIKKIVSDMIRDDYKFENTVVIDGWILSRKEASILMYRQSLYGNLSETTIKRSYENAPENNFASVLSWGPKSTCVNRSFNQQSNGHSSNWFSIDGHSGALQIYFDNTWVPATFYANTITTNIDGDLFKTLTSKASKHKVYIYDPVQHVKKYVGDFVVNSRKNTQGMSNAFGEVESWGPRSTKILTPFNIQKDGRSAFWIKVLCAPKDTVVVLNGFKIPTTVSSNLVIGYIEGLDALKEAKSLELILTKSSDNSKFIKVGEFTIEK
jgi:hypothetical protein